MRWTNLKARAERCFSPSIKGRVELRSASYRESHDQEGRGYITVDGNEVWNMDSWIYRRAEASKIATIVGQTGLPAWDAQDLATVELDAEGLVSQSGFYAALEQYCESPIDKNLTSPQVLIRALAMLDARVGKRRLRVLDTSNEHPMVRYFHELRMQSEGLALRQSAP
jgi:hypothetical protein